MATKLITIKEYVENHSDKSKSQTYLLIKQGKIKTTEKYGKKLIRVEI